MNRQEYEALDDEYLSHEARSLYVMCIRRFMDYQTGLTGHARRVSYQMFKERLEVQRRRGSKEPAFVPTLKQLRGYVDELVAVGLIEKMPAAHRAAPMIFRCVLATTGLLRPDEEGHRKGKEQGHDEGHDETQHSRLFQADEGQNDGQGKGKEEGHSSVTSVTTTTSTADARMDTFAMHAGWKPSPNIVDRMKLVGIDHESIPVDQRKQMVGEFVSYWLTQPGRTHRQSQWDHMLIKQILKTVKGVSRHGAERSADNDIRSQQARKRAAVSAALGDLEHDFLAD